MSTNIRIEFLGIYVLSFFLFSHAQRYTEYEIKAAYLEKFTRFVEWPDSIQIEDTNKPFVIGLIGKSPINSEIENMYVNHRIRNKKVEIKQITDLNNLLECNMLFISETEEKQIEIILEPIKNSPILTICDNKKHAQKGIQIILFMQKKNVVFEIDKDAVQLSGLYMSSLLFELSKKIAKN